MFQNFTTLEKIGLVVTLAIFLVGAFKLWVLPLLTKSNESKAIQPIQKQKPIPEVLNAYERLTILLERIDLPKLIVRVTPISTAKQDYANFLIQNIEQEFQFNVSQQIYISDEAWALIETAKNATIQSILKTALDSNIKDAWGLQSALTLKKEQNSIIDLAKNRLKKELKQVYLFY